MQVDPLWWDEFGVDVAYSDCPAGIMDPAMMFTAEHHEIVNIGAAAVQPVNDVMDLTLHRVSIAPGVGAAAVAGRDGFALRGGDASVFAAHIQWLAFAVQDDWGDLRVAEHPTEFAGGGHAAELQLGAPGLGAHGVDVQDRGQVRPLPAVNG